ncbi:sugar transferase [Blastococcus mobilis]|uniref:Sugar transferase involved in LPS biosynthesis (Colanic, teichoic acid) n=1 Tax=Blastococcus mobilis TaxID=1938746 RepID=A0A238Z205_9ACTN|nr:sugar transferase [Blastococcus mobilis]SNR76873.1 Sugar transferase involved in LPS biosynthesis (colanic, teichoic acid) [Blastococcus mobilis]
MSLDRSLPPHPATDRPLAKAVLDRGGAAVLLVLCAPWLLLIALLLWIQEDGPVLARDRRVGQWGRSFDLLRFRTGVSRTGAALRRYNLDDLPQLVNVLKGDLSFVGPRAPAGDAWPGIPAPYPWLSVKPGLIGPWVSGRAPRTRETAAIELERYLQNWSLTVDLTILWHSLCAALRGPVSGRTGDHP